MLWPLSEQPRPPACALCGAPRVFEVQLMAPLMAVVLECADWLAVEEGGGGEGGRLAQHRTAINAAANWDFVTLAVFTCSANCCGRSDQRSAGAGCMPTHASVTSTGTHGSVVLLAEEHVEMAIEDDCHVLEELKLTG